MLSSKVQDSGALESTLFYLPLTWNGEPQGLEPTLFQE
jgi:hypothetical protein